MHLEVIKIIMEEQNNLNTYKFIKITKKKINCECLIQQQQVQGHYRGIYRSSYSGNYSVAKEM